MTIKQINNLENRQLARTKLRLLWGVLGVSMYKLDQINDLPLKVRLLPWKWEVFKYGKRKEMINSSLYMLNF